MNVLLVCTGNTCRSPMAETLLDDAVDRSSLHGKVKIKSAGTFAATDAGATEEAQQVMEEMGLSLGRHKTRPFTKELAEWADVILAMGKEQIEHMEAIAPDMADKMHTLLGYGMYIDGEPAANSLEVTDPYGGDIEDYRDCAEQIKEAVDSVVSRWEKQGIED
ncbi:MAG: low molecular weight protein arginine phosphatase [Christensenellaceae bacterium]|jgi:protein-tyrosine-phosphatase